MLLCEYLAALLGALLVVLLVYLLIEGVNNYCKYQFFKRNAPGLKVLANPSLFGGHTNQIINIKHNLLIVDGLFKKYGPTVGYYVDGIPAVATIDLEFIEAFALHEKNHINRTKALIPMRELVEDSLMCAENEQWIRLRKAIAPAFSTLKVKSPGVRSNVNKTIDKLLERIEHLLDEAKEARQEDHIEEDAEDICSRYSLALAFTNFFKQNNVVDFRSKRDNYTELVRHNTRAINGAYLAACAMFPVIKLSSDLIFKFHGQGKMRDVVMDYTRQQTRMNFAAAKESSRVRRAEAGSGEGTGSGNEQLEDSELILRDGSRFKRNMIDHITDQFREAKLTEREYFNSTYFVFFASNTTTSDALSRILYNLAYHPEAQEKLRDSILAQGEESEYLSWVINETLRLHPPAPVGCSRTIERDFQTKHGLVPAGTFVFTPAYSIGRLEEFWGADADQFRPERWAHAKSFHPVQFLAFGAGRRACPGKELALMEIKMLLDALLRRYRFERSQVHTVDNSKLVTAPLFFTLVFDTPTYVRISRLK